MRHWVVHTFNLKRLERENIGGTTAALKRTLEKTDSIEDGSKAKVPRTDENDSTIKVETVKNVIGPKELVLAESLDHVTRLNYNSRPPPLIDSIAKFQQNSRQERYVSSLKSLYKNYTKLGIKTNYYYIIVLYYIIILI